MDSKIRYCICCRTNPVHALGKKQCIYCKNCSRYIDDYYTKIYCKARFFYTKKLEKFKENFKNCRKD
jgi:hypothetical protein